jgi:hypothetical protein
MEQVNANLLSRMLEDTRCDHCPTQGDIFICRGPGGVIYRNGHLEQWKTSGYSPICVRPSAPFTFWTDSGPSFSTSGGYWFSIPEEMESAIKYVGKQVKQFKTWGTCGACHNGAFYFQAEVNVWEIFLETIY